MQLYAFGPDGHLKKALTASRNDRYSCPECFGPLRLKNTKNSFPHFSHLQSSRSCRRSQKNFAHLQIQNSLLSIFPSDTLELEKPFPQIKRIADVVHEKEKFIFEIQCSPMSLSEAKERCGDYEALGYKILWLLWDRPFHRFFCSQTERYLRERGAYYVHLHSNGHILVYDQVERREKGRRLFPSHPFVVNLTKYKEVETPFKNWSFYFEGDVQDRLLNGKVELSEEVFVKKKQTIYQTFVQWLLAKTAS